MELIQLLFTSLKQFLISIFYLSVYPFPAVLVHCLKIDPAKLVYL